MTELLRTRRGTVSVAPAALRQIVVRAAESVAGVRVRRPRRGVQAEVGGGRARVSLGLAVPRDRAVTELAGDVQERVAGALRTTCEVEVEAVDVTIEEVDA